MTESEEAEEQRQSSPLSLGSEAIRRVRAQIEAERARAAAQAAAEAVPNSPEARSAAARRVAEAARERAELARLGGRAVIEMQNAHSEVTLFAEISESAGLIRQRRAEGDTGVGRFLLQYVVTPLAVAIIGGGFALGAAKIAADNKSVATPSCMQVYATALEISKDHPTFQLPADDPDQQRCNVNAVLQSSKPTP